MKPNILFIMIDQLRWDYLSCAGHPRLQTKNIDWLASRGVRFNRAYVQSTVCGPSRMSTYTGTYMRTHGATWNGVPLRLDELTLGDYLRPLGVRTTLVGKSHVQPDLAGIGRLGIDPASEEGRLLGQGGFEHFERVEGVYPEAPGIPEARFRSVKYNQYLNGLGYDGFNPWHTWANSWDDSDGRVHSGWLLNAAGHPARVAEEHSETPYLTRRAMECIDQLGDDPWCIHLSYIKPHWPYIAPAPYHSMFGPSDAQEWVHSDAERHSPHPVFQSFMRLNYSQAFSRPEVREAVVPTYMGLIQQLDDQLGVLFAFLRERRLLDRTMIAFTSDHGDYLGDHWLGDKEFFHDQSVRVPLIVYDPRPDADCTRGTVSESLVETIDLVPTFIDFVGNEPPYHRLQGRSLMPLLHGKTPADWRSAAFSEFDFATSGVRRTLGSALDDSKMAMIVTDRWKYMQFNGYVPLLFDLGEDPRELRNVSGDSGSASVCAEMEERLHDWAWRVRRPTESSASIDRRTDTQTERGIILGFWDERELAAHSS